MIYYFIINTQNLNPETFVSGFKFKPQQIKF